MDVLINNIWPATGLGFLAIAIRRLRKIYPVEERKKHGLYVMPGGKMGLNALTVCPFIIVGIALYVNGTEYFVAGFLMLAISLILYLICKWVYGGLYKVDAEKYPINPKTKLAQGDVVHIGIYTLLAGSLPCLDQFYYTYMRAHGERNITLKPMDTASSVISGGCFPHAVMDALP